MIMAKGKCESKFMHGSIAEGQSVQEDVRVRPEKKRRGRSQSITGWVTERASVGTQRNGHGSNRAPCKFGHDRRVARRERSTRGSGTGSQEREET